MIWIIAATIVLLALFAVVAIILKKGKKHKPDYFAIFIMGIIWFVLGIPLDNSALSVMGLVFFTIGLVHQDTWKKNHRKWNNLNKQEKQLTMLLIISLAILVVFGLFAHLVEDTDNLLPTTSEENINSFEDCAAAGYPIMESYPRQCRTVGGKHFVEEIEVPTNPYP